MTVVEQIYKDIENTFSIHDPVRKYFESRKQEWLQKEKAQQEDLCIHSVVEQGEQLVCDCVKCKPFHNESAGYRKHKFCVKNKAN